MLSHFTYLFQLLSEVDMIMHVCKSAQGRKFKFKHVKLSTYLLIGEAGLSAQAF